MRKKAIDMVHVLAKQDPRVVFIGSDLSPGLLDAMKQEFPTRHYMEGITEQNVIGVAAGLAMDGYIPYVNTIATFLTRRCFEQVAVDLCLHNLPVRLIANGGGLVYAPLGPTHLAIEDLAIMRALPNMTVTAACDADEMERLMRASLDWKGPIYIRMAKGGDPVISKPEHGFTIGKAIYLRDYASSKPAKRLLIAACGVATTRALEAAKLLEANGIDVRVLHFHTIKPLDADALKAAAREADALITVEEHTLQGGFGSAVVECLVDADQCTLPVRRLGIPDIFSVHYGSQDALMQHYGIQPEQIAERARQLLQGIHHERHVA